MKILYIVSTLRACGPINQLFCLIKYLDRERFEPHILTLSPEPANSIASRFEKLNVPINSLALTRLKGLFVGASRLQSFVAKHHPNIIHTHGIRADVAANNLSSYKRITTIHNYPLDDYPLKYGKLLGNYTAQRHLRAFKQIDLPVACSNTIKQMVEKHGLRPHVIQNGVDTSVYNRPTNLQKQQLRQKLGLPQQKIFITVGALIVRKQPETVIRGFLASEVKGGMLLVLGDGAERERCEAIANSQPSVKFIGQTNDVVSYLKAADYFISASLAEGLPYSVIEALACGLPVCLSDIEPHREILQFNPEAGQFFASYSDRSLADSLKELVTKDTANSQAATTIVTQHLNAKTMSEKYQLLYASK